MKLILDGSRLDPLTFQQLDEAGVIAETAVNRKLRVNYEMLAAYGLLELEFGGNQTGKFSKSAVYLSELGCSYYV